MGLLWGCKLWSISLHIIYISQRLYRYKIHTYIPKRVKEGEKMNKQEKDHYKRIESKFLELFYNYPKVDGNKIRIALNKLHRYETTLHRISENQCNGYPRTITEIRDGKMYRYEVEDQKWAERDAKKEESIQNKVIELCKQYDIEVKFNGDPRGGAIRMLLPDHTSNNWDQESWGVYW